MRVEESADFSYLDTMACKTEVHLQILTATQPIRLKSRLIGVDPNMSIILAMNNDQEWQAAKNFICEGQAGIIRLLNSEEPEASIFAFYSSIQKIMTAAGQWLVMDYPKKLQRVALRKYARFPIHVKCGIFDKKLERELSNGFLQDISIHGCAFIGSLLEGCEPDASYQLQVKHEGDKEAISVPVSVKNIHNTGGQSEQIRYGFAFLEDCRATQHFIQKTIFYFLLHWE